MLRILSVLLVNELAASAVRTHLGAGEEVLAQTGLVLGIHDGARQILKCRTSFRLYQIMINIKKERERDGEREKREYSPEV